MSHTHLRLISKQANASVDADDIAAMQATIAGRAVPAFQQHHPNLEQLKAQLEPYRRFRNIIIVANGGSRTSALGYYQGLRHLRNDTQVEFIATMEPDVIARLRSQYSPEDTLVMPISKSGSNVDVLEPLLQLLDYPALAVTSPHSGVLYDIASVRGWDIVPHPEVGGRYSGRSECGFAPAYLMGLDIDAINSGAVKAYKQFDYGSDLATNNAFQAAVLCHKQEQAGKTEIFMPVYSVAVAGFLPLLIQLVHESTGKAGLGQTIYGDEAPESQHHTNQRFFAGRSNVMGWFMTVAQQHNQLTTTVPDDIQGLALRAGTLADLHNIPLQSALQFDYEGVAEQATAQGIPHITLEIDSVTPESIGELVSFMHYYTVYAALLRQQDPFDQPAVEAAKTLSFNKRRQYTQSL